MPSRIFLKNRVVYQTPGFPRTPNHRAALPRNASGDPVDCARAIAPTEPKEFFRSGETLIDRDEDLAYRCVARLDPLQGWAPSEFWQTRWKVDHQAVILYARLGWLDAAVEAGSQVRRFRVRDEHTVLSSDTHKKAKARIAANLTQARKRAQLTATGKYGWK